MRKLNLGFSIEGNLHYFALHGFRRVAHARAAFDFVGALVNRGPGCRLEVTDRIGGSGLGLSSIFDAWNRGCVEFFLGLDVWFLGVVDTVHEKVKIGDGGRELVAFGDDEYPSAFGVGLASGVDSSEEGGLREFRSDITNSVVVRAFVGTAGNCQDMEHGRSRDTDDREDGRLGDLVIVPRDEAMEGAVARCVAIKAAEAEQEIVVSHSGQEGVKIGDVFFSHHNSEGFAGEFLSLEVSSDVADFNLKGRRVHGVAPREEGACFFFDRFFAFLESRLVHQFS